ncbi:HNH endonuclease [Caballeronia grimmiae]|uniref:HNH endonuclease n=1 Tax=Caballeronia grimmiae TaxID=1071679 RepID=UPI0038B7F381
MKKINRTDFTVEIAREWFAYDPGAGIVLRIKNPLRGKRVAGQRAGVFHKPSGLRQVPFRGVYVYEHQLVWASCKGCWSAHKLEFVDGDTANVRIENLREITNRKHHDQSQLVHPVKSLPGVVPLESGRYRAQIFRGKIYVLGTYDSAQEAHRVYLEAKSILHSPLNREKSTPYLLSQISMNL